MPGVEDVREAKLVVREGGCLDFEEVLGGGGFGDGEVGVEYWAGVGAGVAVDGGDVGGACCWLDWGVVDGSHGWGDECLFVHGG